MSKAEKNSICVGVDLHKTQFTVYALDEGTGTVELECEFRTNANGYEDFINRMHEIESERGNSIELAVESTGNARFFKKITAPRKTWGFSHAGIALLPRNVYNT